MLIAILFALALVVGCVASGPTEEATGSDSSRGGSDSFPNDADDLAREFLDATPPIVEQVTLIDLERIELKPTPDGSVRWISSLSPAQRGFFLVDMPHRLAYFFSRTGEPIYSLADSIPSEVSTNRPLWISHDSATTKTYLLQSDFSANLLEFGEGGRFAKVLPLPEGRAYTSVSARDGRLAVCVMDARRWAGYQCHLRQQRDTGRGFFTTATLPRPLNPEENIRSVSFPGILIAQDRLGYIYTVGTADYQIRKYSPIGAYLGHFRIQEHSAYKPPPDGVDAEVKRRWRSAPNLMMAWIKTWTQVKSLVVLEDRMLVIAFDTHEEGGDRYRLHFYTLDGRPMGNPVSSAFRLLAAHGDTLLLSEDPEPHTPAVPGDVAIRIVKVG